MTINTIKYLIAVCKHGSAGKRDIKLEIKYRALDGKPYINPHVVVDFDQLTMDTIVCKCVDVTYGDIVHCVECGMTTMKEVCDDLSLVNSCKQCAKLIATLYVHAYREYSPFENGEIDLKW